MLSQSDVEEEDFLAAQGSDLVEFLGQEDRNTLGLGDGDVALLHFVRAVAAAGSLLRGLKTKMLA